jgi:hypothetical protein
VKQGPGLLDTGPLVSFLASGLRHYSWTCEQWKFLSGSRERGPLKNNASEIAVPRGVSGCRQLYSKGQETIRPGGFVNASASEEIYRLACQMSAMRFIRPSARNLS